MIERTLVMWRIAELNEQIAKLLKTYSATPNAIDREQIHSLREQRNALELDLHV